MFGDFTMSPVLPLSQADDIRALLIDAMPPDALPSCLKPQATVVSVLKRPGTPQECPDCPLHSNVPLWRSGERECGEHGYGRGRGHLAVDVAVLPVGSQQHRQPDHAPRRAHGGRGHRIGRRGVRVRQEGGRRYRRAL